MPRPKSWTPRIMQILRHLETDETPKYTRKMVEKVFSIGPSQAAEVMQIAGLSRESRPGAESLVSRSNLLHYVKHSPEAQSAQQEMERRRKLALKLKQSEADLKTRHIPLQVTSADEWTRFQDLPNVSLEPGILKVAFEDAHDLMGQLWRLVKAAGNEWDEFERMCEQRVKAG